MIRRIEIQRFRTLRSVVVDRVGAILCVVGRNGVGKTNFLSAVNLAASHAVSAVAGRDQDQNPWGVVLDVGIDDETYIYHAAMEPAPDGSGLVRVDKLTVRNGNTEVLLDARHGAIETSGQVLNTAPNAGALPATLALLPPGSQVAKRISVFLAFMAQVRYYPLDEPSRSAEGMGNYVSEADYKTWLAHYQSTGDPGRNVLMRLLHMHFTSPESFAELKTLVALDGLNLVSDIQVNRYQIQDGEAANPIYGVDFSTTSDAPPVAFGQLSHGTRRMFRLLVSVLFDKSSVMLIEHPEDSIHRALLRKLFSTLKSYADPTQFVLSSHSSVVLNELLPGMSEL